MRPTDPPEIDENISEEEAQKKVEEARQELKELDERRMQERGSQTARQSIQTELRDQFDKLLTPYFKDTPLEGHAERFKSALSSVVPLANIQRGDIPRYLTYFDELWIWWKICGVKIPPYIYPAFRQVYELQLSRAVDATERKLQTGMVEREKEEESKGLLDFLRGE